MTRNTLNDRTRKYRIREREERRLRQQIAKIDKMTPDQMAVLQKVADATDNDAPLTTAQLPDWKTYREMGVLREAEGNLIVTLLGRETLDVATEGA